MYNYAATISIFNEISNLYILSMATVLLAVIIALYCANFLKDPEDETHRNRTNAVEYADGYDIEEEDDDTDADINEDDGDSDADADENRNVGNEANAGIRRKLTNNAVERMEHSDSDSNDSCSAGSSSDETENHNRKLITATKRSAVRRKIESPQFALNHHARHSAPSDTDTDGNDDDDDDATDGDSDSDTDSNMDVNNDGLVAKLKTRRLKELESQLTRDQLEEERRIEREQLAAIFELLKKQEAELNMKEIDENELNAQLSLYR